MKINKRELIFVGLMLGILCTAWLLVLRPRDKEMDHLQTLIQEKQHILADIQTSRPRAIGNLKKDIDELQKIVNDQQARLPQGEKIEKVFQDLSSLAKANELRIHQIRTNNTTANPLEEDKHPGIDEQGYVLELEGKFQGIQSFLESLEKQPRVLRVDEIRIQRVSTKSEESTVQANLRLRVYNRKGAKT